MEYGPPNLDCMDNPNEVWGFWSKVHFAGRRTAREWFPDRPKGYVRATRDIGNYAANKASAMRCRTVGDILGAQIYELICERIYSQLPNWAKW